MILEIVIIEHSFFHAFQLRGGVVYVSLTQKSCTLSIGSSSLTLANNALNMSDYKYSNISKNRK